MRDEIKKIYDSSCDIFGYPQDYKGLLLYPIKLKDFKYRQLFFQIFAQPKLYIPNKEVLKSSYLKFILYIVQASLEKESIYNNLIELLKYITHSQNVEIQYKEIPNKEGLESVELQIKIDNHIISESEFEDIREIVLEQNGLSIDYIEEYNPQLEEHLSFINRNTEALSFEDEIFTFCAIARMNVKEIAEYTVYQFKYHFEKILVLKEYDLYKPLLVSGQITLKSGEIKPYLYHSAKAGRYDSIKMDVDAFLKGNDEAFKPS